ncbi:MAG: replication initiation protein [Paracoccaceae bacterium]|nr:replication initiation protein [Paracoccaceae bacterium]
MSQNKLTVIDALRMNTDNPDAVIAAGEVVNLRFKSGNQLSLRAAKLFCMLVQHAGPAIADDVQHVIHYSAVNDTFHQSKADLIKAVDELHSTIVSIRITSRKGRNYTKSGPILSDVERDDDDDTDAEIRFTFSPTLQRVIGDSTHWASMSRQAILAFESKYALRIYMFLSLRANLRKTSEVFQIDELRTILGIHDNTLPRWQDLKRRALEPAQAEINHLAGFRMSFQPIKHGRRVTGVRLAWGLKAGDELIDAARELERHRTGRTARREGKVEVIAQEHAAFRHSLASTIAAAPYDDATVAQSHEPNDRQLQ